MHFVTQPIKNFKYFHYILYYRPLNMLMLCIHNKRLVGKANVRAIINIQQGDC